MDGAFGISRGVLSPVEGFSTSRSGTDPGSWRVSPGRMRPFTAFPSWSHMALMGYWGSYRAIGLARDPFTQWCCPPKTDGQLGLNEDVRCPWRWCSDDSPRIAQQRVGERHVPFRIQVAVDNDHLCAVHIPWHSLRVPASLLWHRHRCTGPALCREAEDSCHNIFSIACSKIKWFCLNKASFLPENGHLKNSRGGGGLQPLAPPPPSYAHGYRHP